MHRLYKICAWFPIAIVMLPAIAIGSETLSLSPSTTASLRSHNAELTMTEGGFSVRGETLGQDVLVDFALSHDPAVMADGPTMLSFEMKTSGDAEENSYIVYWVVDNAIDWREFERIPVRPDGQWHEYHVPLSAAGEVKGLRMTFGKNGPQAEVRNVRVRRKALSLPDQLQEKRLPLPKVVQLSTDHRTLEIDSAQHTYRIVDRRTDREWQSLPTTQWLALYAIEQVDPRTLILRMYDRFSEQTVVVNVALTDDLVSFEISADDPSLPLGGSSHYPPSFVSEMDHGKLVFCDRSCGVLLDQQDPTYAHWPLRVYGNTHCLDMPWIGLFDDRRTDGVMLLVESPADAEVALRADAAGRHWPQIRWLPAMDCFGYDRRLSLRFTAAGRHVELARVYRDYLKAEGRFQTLADKAQQKPHVHRLRGAPSLWGGRFPTRFIREMRPLGVTQGIVNTCKDPGIIHWLNEQGYLTGRYDSYTDILQGATDFQSDDVDLTAIRQRPGAPPKHGWTLRSGQQMYWRSSAFWDRAASSYVEQELAKRPYNARFIDVAAAAQLFEDYHPQHQLDRRQDLANRRALFDRMNGYGLVLGTEHGNDWVADQVEYFEGSMSGPFWWSSWPAGYLDRPKREQLSENYLKFGMGYAHRVPLWELVYHDCAVTTWYWGDTAGLLYEAAPELADRKDLLNILYGTTPLLWMDGTGYKLPSERHRMLQTFHNTCQLHKQLAFDQMVSHEFLSDDRAIQRTRFSGGITAVVNFSDEPRMYEEGQQKATLAPRGYWVEGPNFVQSRLWVDGSPQTVISTDGYLTIAADGREVIRGVKVNGRLTTFNSDDDRWNLFVAPDCDCEIDIPAVTGWDSSDELTVCYMDDIGEVRQPVSIANEAGMVRFRSTKDAWRFALVRHPTEKQVAASETKTDDPGPTKL